MGYSEPDLTYKLVETDDFGHQTVIARARIFKVAQAAFLAQVRYEPRFDIDLRQGARVILEHKGTWRKAKSPAA